MSDKINLKVINPYLNVEYESSKVSNEDIIKVRELEKELEDLSQNPTKSDYLIAVVSGFISSVVDVFISSNISLESAQEWGTDEVNKAVIWIAKKEGCKKNDLASSIEFLEKKHPYASDDFTDEFGGGGSHHLNDFTHHFSFLGLLFSIIAQFSGRVYGIHQGKLTYYQLDKSMIGSNFYEKISIAVKDWFFHLVSDIAGSNNSTRLGRAGSGLPGPLLSLVKNFVELPIFENSEKINEVSKIISKLFHGTLISDNGTPIKFDFRTEIGIKREKSKHWIPVALNEVIVRTFYLLTRLYEELKTKKDIKGIDVHKILPFNNRVLNKMLLISSGILTSLDFIVASISSASRSNNLPSFIANFVLKLNFPAIGRFAFALSDEIMYFIRRKLTIHDILELSNERNVPINAETYSLINGEWIKLEITRTVIDSLSKSLLSFNRLSTLAILSSTYKVAPINTAPIKINNKNYTGAAVAASIGIFVGSIVVTTGAMLAPKIIKEMKKRKKNKTA